MVHLQKFHDTYEADGLFVYAIAMHPSPKDARRMNKELGVKYPVFLGTGSELGKRLAYG
jgi:hypothetical protein